MKSKPAEAGFFNGGEMTKDEFIAMYCGNSGMEWDRLNKYRVALPCHCDYDECNGWAMIPRNLEAIEDHMKFYMTKEERAEVDLADL